MALTATVYNFAVQLSDIDRAVYENFDLRVAQQPSETVEYMVTRVLAYCLEYEEGIAMTEGIAAVDEPAVVVRDLTGKLNSWIEVGLPDPDRLHRGSKLASRTALYTHRPMHQVRAQYAGKKIFRAAELPVYSFDKGFIENVAGAITRRVDLAMSITERHLYIDLGGITFSSDIHEEPLG